MSHSNKVGEHDELIEWKVMLLKQERKLLSLDEKCSHGLEALPVNNARARLIILLLGDPHLLEGGEGSKDGASDPDGVFPLWWSNDFDLDGGWGKSCNLLLHAVSNTWVHGGAS